MRLLVQNPGKAAVLLFEVHTPVGVMVRTSRTYWNKIVNLKHPAMRGLETVAKSVLERPEVVRRSSTDPKVLLYYRRHGKYHVCVVVRVLNGDGFVVTAYKTENIKEGERLWPA